MSILESLKKNKGTVSSESEKKLAEEVLNGNKEILKEAIDLSCYCAQDKKEKMLDQELQKLSNALQWKTLN